MVAPVSPERPRSVFEPALIVLAATGPRPPVRMTLDLALALRNLLMRECPRQPPPEWLSGHRPDGTPAREPHLAISPLPDVGHRHAVDRILGLALALPRGLDRAEVALCLEGFLRDRISGSPREHRLFGGGGIDCLVQFAANAGPPRNLDPETWTRPSRVWASVTPVVLNRHFTGSGKWTQAAENVREASRHIGLPRPREVLLQPVPLVEGAPPARYFPPMLRKRDGGRCSHSHAVLVFDQPVQGPVLVGGGRFRGYGLCRPLDP